MNTDSDIVAKVKQSFPYDEVLWTGRPAVLSFALENVRNILRDQRVRILAIFSICVLLLFIFNLSVKQLDGANIMFLIFVIIPCVLGLTISFMKAKSTVYAITDKRLVILSSNSPQDYELSKITHLISSSNRVGKGNLEFRREQIAESASEGGEYIYDRQIGFWGIDNVKMVEETVRDQFDIE